jgi:molybdopterin converting factor small subunit
MAREIRIRLFATARLLAGRSTLAWPVPSGGLRASEVVRQLEAAYPTLSRTLKASRFLRNHRYLDDLTETIRPGDEFAVHPPYGGG